MVKFPQIDAFLIHNNVLYLTTNVSPYNNLLLKTKVADVETKSNKHFFTSIVRFIIKKILIANAYKTLCQIV
jgi:hypothetical protein